MTQPLPCTPKQLDPEILVVLRQISAVMAAEHKWLLKQVEAARRDYDEEVAKGWKDAEWDGDMDSLPLFRVQTDLHLKNIAQAGTLAGRIADMSEALA